MNKILDTLDRKDKFIALFSIFLGVVGVLTKVFLRSSLTQDRETGLTASVFSFNNLGFYVAFTFICYIVLQKILAFFIKMNIYEREPSEIRYKNIYIKVFIVYMICWGIWFWLYFPGAGMNDTINCIRSFHNDNQPLIYQLILYYGINGLTKLTSNMTISYAVLTLAQMAFMSLCIAWIAKWLYKKGLKRVVVNLFIAYYALLPIIADYSITLVKDSLFGVCLMMIIPLLYDIINDGIIRMSFLPVLLGICFLRSNGKYIVFILLLLMLMRISNKRFLIAVLGIVIVANGIVAEGEKKLIVSDVSFRESIGVPLAQIGAVLAMDGAVGEEDREVLEQLLPLETWGEVYCFWFSDPIKFNGNFDNEWLNANKGKFLKTWFSILKDNFGIYVKAYLCHTYGLWNISPFNPTDYSQSYFTQINNNTSNDSEWGIFCADNNLVNREIKSGSVAEQIREFHYNAVCMNLLLRPGIMFWSAMWLVIVICIYRRYQICYIFLPAVLNWLTMMIAAPGSYIYRYSFYLTLSLPLFFIITLMQIKEEARHFV